MIRHSTCIAMFVLVIWIKAFVEKTVSTVGSPGHLATLLEHHPLMLLADAFTKKSKSVILKTSEEKLTKLLSDYDQNCL